MENEQNHEKNKESNTTKNAMVTKNKMLLDSPPTEDEYDEEGDATEGVEHERGPEGGGITVHTKGNSWAVRRIR